MSIETLSANPDHFVTHHEGDETIICMQHRGQCSVVVEVEGTSEQQMIVEQSSMKALKLLDDYFDGKFAEVFSGLTLRFGKYDGGGEAHQDQNLITFDTERMCMSLADAEAYLVEQGFLSPGDWTQTMTADASAEPGSCLAYNLPHEVGHMIDERAEDGTWIGVRTALSPTKYGSSARNEAGAEVFAYMVHGQNVDPDAHTIISRRVEIKRSGSNG